MSKCTIHFNPFGHSPRWLHLPYLHLHPLNDDSFIFIYVSHLLLALRSGENGQIPMVNPDRMSAPLPIIAPGISSGGGRMDQSVTPKFSM
jgi:hypothetical protein